MKCNECGEDIEKNFGEQYTHKRTGMIYCYPDRVAIPRKLPSPGEWCTGQQWVDAGGSWDEFVEAHKNDPEAEYYYVGSAWRRSSDYGFLYKYSKDRYRLRLNDKGELPKPEDYVKIRKKQNITRPIAEILKRIDNVIRIQCSDGNWNDNPYMHGMANGMKMIKSIVDGKDPEFLDAPKEWLCDKDTSEKCKEQREVPLINPLLIPLGWWVAMDKDGYWCGYPSKPHLGSHYYYHYKTQIYLGNKIDWQGDWKDSLFTRQEILERWKQEYGDRWLEVAESEE